MKINFRLLQRRHQQVVVAVVTAAAAESENGFLFSSYFSFFTCFLGFN